MALGGLLFTLVLICSNAICIVKTQSIGSCVGTPPVFIFCWFHRSSLLQNRSWYLEIERNLSIAMLLCYTIDEKSCDGFAYVVHKAPIRNVIDDPLVMRFSGLNAVYITRETAPFNSLLPLRGEMLSPSPPSHELLRLKFELHEKGGWTAL